MSTRTVTIRLILLQLQVYSIEIRCQGVKVINILTNRATFAPQNQTLFPQDDQNLTVKSIQTVNIGVLPVM